MTRKEAINGLKENLCAICAYGSPSMETCDITSCDNRDYIKFLEQEDCDYAMSKKQSIGAWIIIDDCEKFIAKCSKCGRVIDSRLISKFPYCRCGTKMEEAERKGKEMEK